jgi:NADPH2:quinone reductase
MKDLTIHPLVCCFKVLLLQLQLFSLHIFSYGLDLVQPQHQCNPRPYRSLGRHEIWYALSPEIGNVESYVRKCIWNKCFCPHHRRRYCRRGQHPTCWRLPRPKAAQPGFTPGYDLVGEIMAIGPAVPKACGLNVGDRVTSLCRFGGHATHIMLPYEDLIRIEPTDDPIKICTLPLNYMTAWGMLKHSGVELRPGSSILIGSVSGGIGTAVAQLVTAFNMDIKMIGTCSPSKFDYIRSLGVEPLDRNAPDLVDQVYKLTNGKGVDVAYDGVCSEESVKNFLAATKAEVGKVIVFGIMGDIAADGSKMLGNVQENLGKRLQPPRITFFALDTSFHRKPEVAEFHAIVEKVEVEN